MKLSAADTTRGDSETGQAQWSGRTRGGLIGNWIFVALVRVVGLRCAYAVLIPVAFYFLFFAPTALAASHDYRSRVGLKEKNLAARLWGAFRHFYSFGQILLDRIAIIAAASSKFRFEFDGEEHIRSALEEGKGLVLVSAHCGNWEIAGHLLKRLEVPVNVVAYEGEIARIQKFLGKALKERNFSFISMDGSAGGSLAIRNALARGEIVAMLADRWRGSKTEYVPFLGAPAKFPTGPYIVAALSGAPLIHAFTMREGTYKYHLQAYPAERPSFPDRKNRGKYLRIWIAAFAGRLEDKLREFPLQWHNFYDFWDGDMPKDEKPTA